ncbi:MAG: hypothetical protein P8X49_15715 [Syntrophobacterales bacterium]
MAIPCFTMGMPLSTAMWKPFRPLLHGHQVIHLFALNDHLLALIELSPAVLHHLGRVFQLLTYLGQSQRRESHNQESSHNHDR